MFYGFISHQIIGLKQFLFSRFISIPSAMSILNSKDRTFTFSQAPAQSRYEQNVKEIRLLINNGN